jgi:hypothetical protein
MAKAVAIIVAAFCFGAKQEQFEKIEIPSIAASCYSPPFYLPSS